MDTHGTDLTIDQMINNENIKADRFGMAAISYIFKAFGDDIRSKEYWPWSEKDNCGWPGLRGEYHLPSEYLYWAEQSINRASTVNYTADNIKDPKKIFNYINILNEIEQLNDKEITPLIKTDISIINNALNKVLERYLNDDSDNTKKINYYINILNDIATLNESEIQNNNIHIVKIKDALNKILETYNLTKDTVTDISLVQLKERLKKSFGNVIDMNSINEKINNTSEEVINKINDLTNTEDE